MTNRFLISVAAAALIAGTGFANAQGTGMSRDTGSAGSAAQQSAPPSERGGASSGGAMQRDSGGTSGVKGAESGTKGESGMKADSTDKAEPRSKSAQDGDKTRRVGGRSLVPVTVLRDRALTRGRMISVIARVDDAYAAIVG